MTVDMAVADEKGAFNPDPEDGRESWDSKLQFMLATIGYAVGLGNVNSGDSLQRNDTNLYRIYLKLTLKLSQMLLKLKSFLKESQKLSYMEIYEFKPL